MAKKQLDPLKAKQQKQKKILAVLGVIFLGVVAFMGPKLWKQLHPPPLPPRRSTARTVRCGCRTS